MRLLLLLLSVLFPLFAAEHVVVIGIDGLTPLGIKGTTAKTFQEIMRRGAWTFHARGVLPTVSSPNWASMIMGAGPEQHGITSNEWQSNQFQIAPVCRGSAGFFPTMFGELRAQKPSSHIGVIHDWQGFGRLVESSAPTYIRHVKGSAAAADAAVSYWTEHRPTLLFLHLDDVDHAGHDEGWLSGQYYQAVSLADTYVEKVLRAIEQSPVASSTVLIITADHGGTGKSHGAPSMQDLEIPWMAIGAGINAKELTSTINTYDTAATVAHLLGIKPNPCWIGKPVLDALIR